MNIQLHSRVALLVVSIVFIVNQHSLGEITISTVPVGNVGNLNDPQTGGFYGRVDYAYRIGTYEVTVGQYTAFLNAVAATDRFELYNPYMEIDTNIAGIARAGSPGSYVYSVIGSPNHPVTYVSWGDAARFANWLHNGQRNLPQNAATTERGAYTLDGATTPTALMAVTRNTGARWFLPSGNEWYKAAYYQPQSLGGDVDGYWTYPMKTNSPPYSDQPPGATPDNTRVANYFKDDSVANGYDDGYAVSGLADSSFGQNYLTDVGAYSLSASYYGTFDQGGNVREWTEFAFADSQRRTPGGAWHRTDLSANDANGYAFPIDEYASVGFRVANFVPEPGTLVLSLVGAAILGLMRKRSRR